jgi:hypothetical protein
MVVACSIPSAALHRCSSVIWVSRVACSPVSSSWWLRCPPLGVDLPSVGSHLLLLLVRLLLIWEGLHSWLGRHRLHHDYQDGLEGWSALRDWCGDGGVRLGHHVASLGAGGSQAPPASDVAPFSLEYSLRGVRLEGDPLWTIPMNMPPESRRWGEKLRWPKQSVRSSRLLKWMVLPGAGSMSVGLLSLAMNESFDDGTIRTSRGEARCKPPFLARQLSMVFCTDKI